MTDIIKRKWAGLTGSARVGVVALLGAALVAAAALLALAAGEDADGDGMSDAYESFFGLKADDAADAAADPDRDAPPARHPVEIVNQLHGTFGGPVDGGERLEGEPQAVHQGCRRFDIGRGRRDVQMKAALGVVDLLDP